MSARLNATLLMTLLLAIGYVVPVYVWTKSPFGVRVIAVFLGFGAVISLFKVLELMAQFLRRPFPTE